MPINELLHSKLRGRIIEDGVTFYEAITGKILVEKVNPGWLIFSEGFDYGRLTFLIKRVLDLKRPAAADLFPASHQAVLLCVSRGPQAEKSEVVL